MKKTLVLFLSAGFLVLTMTACTPSGNHEGNNSDRPIYLGALDKKISDIYSKENEAQMEICDLQWRPLILEISRVLEQKRTAIEELSQQNPADSSVPLTSFGSFQFYNDLERTVGQDQWESHVTSWSRIAKIYEWIKDSPSDRRWVTINNMARGIVVDDERRIVFGGFYGLSRNSGPMITGIATKVTACFQDTQCTNPSLTNDESNFLSISKYYAFYINALRSAKRSDSEKREILKRFVQRVKGDADRFGFYKPATNRLDGNTLVVPMDLTALGDDGAAKFVEDVEKMWNKDSQYSIKVESVKSPVPSYAVQVDNELGGRAFVSHQKKIMQLHNWGRVKTFIHEFGHILGFKDNYYTTWNTDTCAYTYESNSGDVMSNSTDGTILPGHWESLKKAYWAQ